MSKPSLPDLPYTIELIRVEDIPSLQLLVALKHNLIGGSKYISAGKESKSNAL